MSHGVGESVRMNATVLHLFSGRYFVNKANIVLQIVNAVVLCESHNTIVLFCLFPSHFVNSVLWTAIVLMVIC